MDTPSYSTMTILRRVLGYLKPHWLPFAGGITLTLLGIGLDLLKPLPLALVLDVVLSGKPLPGWLQPWIGDWSPMAQLALAAGAIVVLTVARGFATLGSNYLTISVGQYMVNDLRAALWAHLQKLSLKFHNQQQTGDLLFRVTADTFSVQGMLMNGLLPLAGASVMLVGMFAVMWSYDHVLALVALLVGPPLYLAISRLSGTILKRAAASKEAESDLYVRTETTIGAVKLVQAYGKEDVALADFRRGSERSLALSLKLYSAETVFILVVDSLLALGTAALVFLGALRVMQGQLNIGDLTIFLSYLRDMYQPIQGISQQLAELSSAKVGLDRVFAVLDVQPDIQDAPGAQPLPSTPRGEIRLEDVSFAYEEGSPVLKNVDLHIRPGEKIALVGRTGAGKTTLASMVLRFFDPQGGRVTIDGHDLRAVTLRSLRNAVTLMLQEPILFRTTVAENIAFGAIVPPARIKEAAQRAEAEPFIVALKDGYDTVIGEDGDTLSGGQRQRLSLARALLRDTPIVILDEPTSSLDVRTEALVWRNMEELLRGKTGIIIAHRLSTARMADRIVVLEAGRIVEEGPHGELLARRGVYWEMWQHGGAGTEGAAVAGA
jgi:ATP-binding cassette, subfamily B, bacterial